MTVLPADPDLQSGVEVLRDVMVPMRDGVLLATDIYRPAGAKGPLPLLLERTPYDKSGTNIADRTAADPRPRSRAWVASGFARAGYAVAVQDCRGRYNSQGVFTKYLSEGHDGFDTVQWLLAQPWCDGRIGTYGLSYGAHVQTALAAMSPPGLKAMFLDSGGFSSAFHSGIRQGGAFELKQATWAYKHALLSPETRRDPARRQALEAEDIRDWFARMPWSKGHSPLRAAPEYEDYLFEQWQSGVFDEQWRQPALYARGFYDAFPPVAAVHLTGWYDPYARTAIENFTGMAARADNTVRLVLGPWTHGQRSVSFAGDVDFGPSAILDGNLAPDYTALRLAWFDRHLKKVAAPSFLQSPVTVFVMGGGSGRRNADGRLDHGGRWCELAAWPPPEARATDFHLHDSGMLSREAAVAADAWCELVADPACPVPTIGGATASGAPVMEAGAFDLAILAERDDVLVFETTPLERDLEIAGPVSLELFLSSDAPDADIAVTLSDFHPPSADWPQGFAMNLCHGIQRLRYRDSFEHPERMQPGQVYKVRVEAYPTANRFLAGHRLRLHIAGSNFPHFDVNPNTGAPEGGAGDSRVARSKIYMDASHRSRLILPVVKG
jgi:putative CocE/NonD family hydrolase